jgi:hypothetical protein
MHTNVWSFECVESIKQHEYQMQLRFKHCVLFEVIHNMLFFSMLGLFGRALASFSFGSLLPLNKELFFLSLFSKRLGFSNYCLVRHLCSDLVWYSFFGNFRRCLDFGNVFFTKMGKKKNSSSSRAFENLVSKEAGRLDGVNFF